MECLNDTKNIISKSIPHLTFTASFKKAVVNVFTDEEKNTVLKLLLDNEEKMISSPNINTALGNSITSSKVISCTYSKSVENAENAVGNLHETSIPMESSNESIRNLTNKIAENKNLIKRYNIKKLYSFYATNEIWILTDNFNMSELISFNHDIFDFEKSVGIEAFCILAGTDEITENNLPFFDYEKEIKA